MAITSNVAPAAAPNKQTLATAYIDFTDTGSASANWAQQYLPDLMEKEAEIFGNRTISGFLSQVGAEESMTSDQVVWSEQSRLHLSYTCTLAGSNGLTLVATHDADGVAVGTTAPYTDGEHGMRAGDMLLVADADKTVKAYVSAVSTTGTVSIQPYGAATMTAAGIANGAVKVLVFGSEYSKGGTGRDGANKANFKSYTNKPIILKINMRSQDLILLLLVGLKFLVKTDKTVTYGT